MNNRYYYWDKNFTNESSETLEECYNKYGMGRQKVPINNVNYTMDVIYLDEERKFDYSWCLKVYNKKRGTNIPVRLYEDKKVYGSCPYKFQ